MKSIKTLAAGLLASALVSMTPAFATPVVIHITGSTAFRGSVHSAIDKIFGGTSAGVSNYTYAWYTDPTTGFSSFGKATTAIFHGTTVAASGTNQSGITAGLDLIIKVYWSGSVGGCKAIVNGTTPAGLSQNWWLSETSNTLTNTGNSLTTPVYNEGTVKADFAMADNLVASAGFSSANIVDHVVGIVPFVYVKSRGTSASVTNINALQYQGLQTTGLPLSQITGVAADSATTLLAMGRDEDSGTRLDGLAEPGFGIFTPAQQYQPTIDFSANNVTSISVGTKGSGYTSVPTVTINAVGTGSGATAHAVLASGQVSSIVVDTAGSNYNIAPTVVISGGGGSGAAADANVGGAQVTDAVLWPASTVNGVSYPLGDSGYANGPDLANAMNASAAASLPNIGGPANFIAYLSIGDAAGVNGGANNLTYNGNTYSLSNVQEGVYTFWSYEHLIYKNTLSGTPAAVAFGIGKQIFLVDATGSGTTPKSINVTTMHVNRSSEGAVISYGNPYTSYQ